MNAADDSSYTLPELSAAAGVTPRTIRYYIREGLLRSPGTTGPGAKYDAGHLNRLRLIKQLQRHHLRLAEIRSRLAALTEGEVEAALMAPAESVPTNALDYVRAVLSGKGVSPPPRSDRHRGVALQAESLQQLVPSPRQPAPSLQESAVPSQSRLPSPPPPDSTRPPGVELHEASPPVMGIDRDLASSYTPLRSSTPDRSSSPNRSSTPDRSSWERITLSPDIELHVRRPLSRQQNRFLGRLIQLARKLLQEELP